MRALAATATSGNEGLNLTQHLSIQQDLASIPIAADGNSIDIIQLDGQWFEDSRSPGQIN